MEITLSAVIEAARLRRAGVTAEVAGYVVLLATRLLLPAARHVSAASLVLTETGDLRLLDTRAASAAEVEAELRHLLATLTSFAQSAAPALKLAAEREAAGDLRGLEAELAAALIPLNHAAARRALARLYRETEKVSVSFELPGAGPSLEASVTASPIAVASTPYPPRAERYPSALDDAADLEIDVDVVDEVVEARALAPTRAGVAPELAPIESAAPEARSESSRSDLRELLAGFLAHTRSEEQMTAELRRMIGLDAVHSRRTPSVVPPPLLAPATSR